MGLTSKIGRLAAGHAHVLVVEAPDSWQTRAAVERAALTRGWRLAFSPADADVLAVCGEPGPQIGEATELVWHQMPGPRVRVDVRHRGEAAARLDEAHACLLDLPHHRSDARSRPAAPDLLGHGDMDHGDMDHGDMDHGDMDHGDMDHGDMEMSPGGIPLAGGGEDRDGLEMDVLNVRLGPVLPHWPAGLVLRCALQGDVITEAGATLLDNGVPDGSVPSATRARRVDNLAALLALAGWEDAAAEARVVRDLLLDEGRDAETGARMARLRRRIRRSWVLRWSLRGIRPLSEGDLHEQGLPSSFTGDTHDRLLRMLERTEDDVTGERVSVAQLARLVTGLDLATARLVVASLDLDQVHSGRADREGSHV